MRSPSAAPACASRPASPTRARIPAHDPQVLPARPHLPVLPAGPAGGVGRGGRPRGWGGAGGAGTGSGAGGELAGRREPPAGGRAAGAPRSQLRAGRGAHRRAGGRVPDRPRRHLREPAACARVPARQPVLRRGPRVHQRHLPQPQEGHRTGRGAARRPAAGGQDGAGGHAVIVRAGSVTDVGKVRASNQDCLVAEDGLFAVADGVGGHRGGEVASQTAVDALKAAFTERTTSGLVEAVRNANHAVYERSRQDDHLRGMGTTMTAVALVEEDGEERLAVVNVGDSRAYLLQQGELSQLTEDHSLVEELVRAGRLSPEDAIDHPQRSMITRALGLEPDVEVDSWQLLPFAGDRVLLCSDGLTNEVRDERIASVLRQVDDPQAAAVQLVDEAKRNGGNDNISVIVIDVVDDEGRA